MQRKMETFIALNEKKQKIALKDLDLPLTLYGINIVKDKLNELDTELKLANDKLKIATQKLVGESVLTKDELAIYIRELTFKYRRELDPASLMRAAIGKARTRGLTRIELTVREHNKPAIALYEKLGFQVEGLHRNAVRVDSKYENHISMALLFE